MSEIDEIVGEFLVESYENLDRFDEDVLSLEPDATDTGVAGRGMKTWMQPIGIVWNKLLRVARHLSLACGKQVELDDRPGHRA